MSVVGVASSLNFKQRLNKVTYKSVLFSSALSLHPPPPSFF